jgi:2-methylisocitrate lyase-like PEP mutase family enzyme
MLDAVARIVRSVAVPVTADLEAGYDDVAATTRELVAAGAVGLNFEDMVDGTLVDLAQQCEDIRTIRRVSRELGVDVVINARTDVYLGQVGAPETRFAVACERLHAFREAGADCLFVPAVTAEPLIRAFVDESRHPLNILPGGDTPPLSRLQEIGVARVSLGSGLYRSALGHARAVASAVRDGAPFSTMTEGSISFAELNR